MKKAKRQASEQAEGGESWLVASLFALSLSLSRLKRLRQCKTCPRATAFRPLPAQFHRARAEKQVSGRRHGGGEAQESQRTGRRRAAMARRVGEERARALVDWRERVFFFLGQGEKEKKEPISFFFPSLPFLPVLLHSPASPPRQWPRAPTVRSVCGRPCLLFFWERMRKRKGAEQLLAATVFFCLLCRAANALQL